MTVTEIDDITLKGESGVVRSPGLHLSAIIKEMMRELEPERFSGPLDALKIEAGFSFERALESGLRAKFDWQRPGEFSKDGVACSPDGICTDPDGTPTVEELKFTWMSSKEAPLGTKFWHWLVQIKAYCYVVNTFRARLRAFFVNGDYRHTGPQFRCWQFEFTARELAENWSMLLSFAKHKGLLKT